MKYWQPFSFWLIPCSIGNGDLRPPQLTAAFHDVLVLAFHVPGGRVLFVSVLFPYALFPDVHVPAVQLHVSPFVVVFLFPLEFLVLGLGAYAYDQRLDFVQACVEVLPSPRLSSEDIVLRSYLESDCWLGIVDTELVIGQLGLERPLG